MNASLEAPLTAADNRIGYVALGLGILAVITSPLLVGLLFGSLAVTLGLAGSEAVEDGLATNRKSTTAAVVMGVIACVIALVAMVVRIVWLLV
jgi:hypothetical protein